MSYLVQSRKENNPHFYHWITSDDDEIDSVEEALRIIENEQSMDKSEGYIYRIIEFTVVDLEKKVPEKNERVIII